MEIEREIEAIIELVPLELHWNKEEKDRQPKKDKDKDK